MCTLLLEQCSSGIFINNEIRDILCLLFADEVVNYDETVLRLQQQLDIIVEFCLDTGMEANLYKTEVIVFKNGGSLRQFERWFYQGSLLKTLSFYQVHGFAFYTKTVM